MVARNVGAGLLSLFLLAPSPSHGQAPSKLEFEVASIRASTPEEPGQRRIPPAKTGGPGTNAPLRITYSRMELVTILADAFGVYWDRIVGPDWIQTDRYDIVANVPSGTTKEQAIQMLRNLFVERFHMTFHIQDKAAQGYELDELNPREREPNASYDQHGALRPD